MNINLTTEAEEHLNQEAEKLNSFHGVPGLFTAADVLKLFVEMDKRQKELGNPTIIDAVIKGNTADLKA